MKSAGKARNNGLYRHIRTSKEIIRNLLNDLSKCYSYFEILPIFLLHYSYTKTAFSTSYSTTLTIFVRSL